MTWDIFIQDIKNIVIIYESGTYFQRNNESLYHQPACPPPKRPTPGNDRHQFFFVGAHNFTYFGVNRQPQLSIWGWTLKWWFSPTTIGFPYSKWPFWGVKWGYHHFRKPPIYFWPIYFGGLEGHSIFFERFRRGPIPSTHHHYETVHASAPSQISSVHHWADHPQTVWVPWRCQKK